MSERTPDRIWSGIEISKVIAGTLAAITAAVVGSFLGVAGTLAGAAVASVVGSIGTEIYQRSLNKGAQRLSAIAPSFVKAPAAVGTPPVAAATEDESPSHTVAPGRNIRWGHVAIAATTLFVLAVGSLTVFELLAGKSLPAAVGASSTGRTSVSSILGDDSAEKPAVKPTTDPSPTPTEAPTTDPTTEPTSDETTPTTEPTTTPPDATTEPTTEATTEPTSAPEPPPADTPDQQQDREGTTPE